MQLKKILIVLVVLIFLVAIWAWWYLSCNDCDGWGTPHTEISIEAGRLVRDLITTPELIKNSREVVFLRETPSLFVKSIAEASKGQVPPDQICLSLGDFKDDKLFAGSTNKLVKYNATEMKKLKLKGMCDYSKEIAQSLADQDPKMKKWFDEANCDCPAGKTCCFLALVET